MIDESVHYKPHLAILPFGDLKVCQF